MKISEDKTRKHIIRTDVLLKITKTPSSVNRIMSLDQRQKYPYRCSFVFVINTLEDKDYKYGIAT